MFERTKQSAVRFFYMLLFIAVVGAIAYVAYCNWSYIVAWNDGMTGNLRLIIGSIITLSCLFGFILSKEDISGFGLLFGVIFTVIAFGVVIYFKFIALDVGDAVPYAIGSLIIYYVTVLLRTLAQRAG